MAKCTLDNTSLEQAQKIHNAYVKFRKSLLKDLKKQFPEGTKDRTNVIHTAYKQTIEKYDMRPLLSEIGNKAQQVYRTTKTGRKIDPIDVYGVEKTDNGYKVLHITPVGRNATIINVDNAGSYENSIYDMANLKATYEFLNKDNNTKSKTKVKSTTKPKTKTKQSTSSKVKSEPEQMTMQFNSSFDSKIDFDKENAEVISADVINDPTKLKQIFDHLVQTSNVELTQEHITLLENTLSGITDFAKQSIPEMMMYINEDQTKNDGKMILGGKDEGVYVGVSKGAQVAGNDMSAPEVYVHELNHASLEAAQAFQKEKIVDTMNDIIKIYEQFLNVITVDDFMPPLGTRGNATVARENAENRIKQLRDPKSGVNEFIVMSNTNFIVKNVLENKITVKQAKHTGKTLWQKLMALIHNIYDGVYSKFRGNNVNLDGFSAMEKYIKELQGVNNQAVTEISKRNAIMGIIAQWFKWLNVNLAKYVQKLLGKLKQATGTEDGNKFESELMDYQKNGENYTKFQTFKFFSKLMMHWLLSTDKAIIGSFETYLENGPGKLLSGLGDKFEFLKPEGDIQQLIRGVRDSDDFETLIEKRGLDAGKIEDRIEVITEAQSSIIQALFKDGLTQGESEALTHGIADIEMDSLINPLLGKTDEEQVQTIKNVLGNKQLLEKEMNDTKLKIRENVKNQAEYNFIINQSIGLGNYMITGSSSQSQMTNSFMIYGASHKDMSRNTIIERSTSELGLKTRAYIDKLATLQAIKDNDKHVNEVTLNVMNKHSSAVVAIMKYDKMARNEYGVDKYAPHTHDIQAIKGRHTKIGSSYITSKVNLKSDKDKLFNQNYREEESLTYGDEFAVYLNTDFTKQGINSEGFRHTSDSQKINSYTNAMKDNILEPIDAFDLDKIFKAERSIKVKMKKQRENVMEELASMRMDSYIPSSASMRPIFAMDRYGKMFVTDMDINVNQRLLDIKMKTKNRIETVLAKTVSKAYDIYASKKNNMKILKDLFIDAQENFIDGKEHGATNLQSYVKIGQFEDNKISKELWGMLPRYIKVNIFTNHYDNKMRDIAKIADDYSIHDNSIWTEKAYDLRDEIKSMNEDINGDSDKIISLYKKMNMILANNLTIALKKNNSNALNKNVMQQVQNIKKSKPYIAVRRNMVYHIFGNREPAIFNLDNIKDKNLRSVVVFLKKVDMVWKHLIKITKLNIVLRDLPILMYNMLSNVLLAVLNGANPYYEVKNQITGFKELYKYRQNMNIQGELELKTKAGTITPAETAQYKIVTARMNKSPVKPLIDAGLYTSSNEDISNKELHKETYLDEKVGKWREKLPDGVNNIINYLYLTKETQAYSMLLMAMQYGDFGARYASYYRLLDGQLLPENSDENIAKNKVTRAKAAKQVLDNQINYGFSHGKILQWLNARGFVMFSMFIEKIQRVIKRTSAENPFNVSMAVLTQGFMFDDSPLGDFMLASNPTNRMFTPWDILTILMQKPAAVQIITNDYN